MPDDASALSLAYAAPSEPGGEANPRFARAEARLAMLRELAELGMTLTRNLVASTQAPAAADRDNAAAEPPPPRHDPANAFARLSRAVRLTLALEASAEDDLATLRAEGSLKPVKGPTIDARDAKVDQPPLDPFPPVDHPSAFRNKVRDCVYRVLNAEVEDLRPAQERMHSLYERLQEGRCYDAFIYRPLREAVAAICDDLGLSPNWTGWTDDGWPPEPPPPPGVGVRCWEMMWGPKPDWMRAPGELEEVLTRPFKRISDP